MVQRKTLEGLKFNAIELIEKVGTNKLQKSIYRCRCDCGNEIVLVGSSVKSGNTKSCGCNQYSYGHGLHKHPLYQKYHDMKSRCENKDNKWFYRYGARGINVEWKTVEQFYEWSIENGWKEGLSIERINPDGNYSPQNCEYITVEENSRRSINAQFRRDDGTLRGRST